MDDSSEEELVRAEEIYDLDTATLREKLQEAKADLEKEADPQRKEKLASIIDIMTLEVEERGLALDFEENCEKILGSMQAVFEGVDLLVEQNRNMLQGSHSRSHESFDDHPPIALTKNKVLLPPIDPARLVSSSTQSDLVHNSSRLSRSTSNSRAITSTQCSDYRIAGDFDAIEETHQQSRLYPRRQGGKAGWLDFVKNTLNSTKVQNQVPSVGQGVFKKPPKLNPPDTMRSSASKERGEPKHPTSTYARQIEEKKKMREATKVYAESTRKKNQLESNQKPLKLQNDVHATETDRQILQRGDKRSDLGYSIPRDRDTHTMKSITSPEQQKPSLPKQKSIRVSSNSNLPQHIPAPQTSGQTKRSNSKAGSSNHAPSQSRNHQSDHKRIRENTSSKTGSKSDYPTVVAIEPCEEAAMPIIDPAAMWKTEDHSYVATTYARPPLEAGIPQHADICFHYIAKVSPSKASVSTAEPVPKGPKEMTRSVSTKTPLQTIHEVNRKAKVPQKGEASGHSGGDKSNNLSKKAEEKPIKRVVDAKKENPKVPNSLRNKPSQRSGKTEGFEQAKPQTNVTDIAQETTTLKASEQEKMAVGALASVDPRPQERAHKPLVKSVRKDEAKAEEVREQDEKRIKINNQIEVWKATKTVTKQMRSTSDLRSLLPEPMDYSDSIPTWAHLFSETYGHKENIEPDIVGAMRDVGTGH
jgi:hypothetical protein